MIKNLSFIWPLLMMAMMLSSCEIIGGIFKAGVWVGIIAVVLIIALIIWLFKKLS